MSDPMDAEPPVFDKLAAVAEPPDFDKLAAVAEPPDFDKLAAVSVAEPPDFDKLAAVSVAGLDRPAAPVYHVVSVSWACGALVRIFSLLD